MTWSHLPLEELTQIRQRHSSFRDKSGHRSYFKIFKWFASKTIKEEGSPFVVGVGDHPTLPKCLNGM